MLFIAITLLILFIAVLIVISFEEHRQQARRAPAGTIGRIWKGHERRQDIRVPIVLPASYILQDHPDREERSKVWNVSDAGVAVVVTEKLLPGTWLNIHVMITEDEPPLHLNGCVAWTKALTRRDVGGRRMFESGISLAKLGEEEQRRFNRFVKSLHRKNP